MGGKLSIWAMCKMTVFLSYSLVTILAFGWSCRSDSSTGEKTIPDSERTVLIADGPERPDASDLSARIQEALLFSRQHGLNSQIAVLVDFGLHSGRYRCFVVKLPEGRVVEQGLIAHGSGKNGLEAGERQYSNLPDSYLSSLGIYKTGGSYMGSFGLAYKLHGLEASNSKAYERFIVLHGFPCVTDSEEGGILCQSLGCPAVSPAFMKILHKIIGHSSLPVLLWIYDSQYEYYIK